jgi:hypothetical protein
MAYPQSTLEQIVDSERSMFLDAESRYGRYFKFARTSTMYLTLCVVAVEYDRSDTFGRFFSLMKKHHTLAFLSALRLHKVQAMVNLRLVLEAGAGAAYAIANPDFRGFADIDAFGIMDTSKKLSKQYKWLKDHYPEASKDIEDIKKQINDQNAHANIISAHATFLADPATDVVALPFFDAEDEHIVQTDLWRIGRAAITLMELFYGITKEVALEIGRSVVEFRPDFPNAILGLKVDSDALLDEIKESDRYKTALRKEQERSEAKEQAARQRDRRTISCRSPPVGVLRSCSAIGAPSQIVSRRAATSARRATRYRQKAALLAAAAARLANEATIFLRPDSLIMAIALLGSTHCVVRRWDSGHTWLCRFAKRG